MPNTENGQSVAKNYTPEAEALIASREPLNWEICKELAEKLDKSPQSIAAKASHMGLEYQKKEPAKKRVSQRTKSEIVSEIETLIDYPVESLVKANLKDLSNLLSVLNVRFTS